MSIFWRKNIFCENTGAGFCFTRIFRVAMTSIPAGSCHSQTDIPPCDGRWSSNHCRCNAVILPAYCGGNRLSVFLFTVMHRYAPFSVRGLHLPLLPWCWTAAIPTSWRTPPLPCSWCWVWQRFVLSTAAFLHPAFWPAFLPAAFVPVSGGIAAQWLISRCRAE